MSSKRLVTRLGGMAFRAMRGWLGGKSPTGAEAAGARLGRLAFRISRKHRERALGNLKLAFPEKSEPERERLAQGVLEHFGRTMSDFMRASSRSHQEVLNSITFEGYEHVQAALDAGKGAILVTGHFGNWERMAHWFTAMGHSLAVVARDANDPEMNTLVNELRESTGVEVISRGNAARAVLAKLRRNELVGILPDQNSEEIFVPFFGHPCGTVQGPAVLSLRAGAPIIPTYCYWVSPGKYRMVIEPPLVAEPGFEPVEGLTRALNLSLENAIRRAPEQYLWIHNRWKSAKARGLVPSS